HPDRQYLNRLIGRMIGGPSVPGLAHCDGQGLPIRSARRRRARDARRTGPPRAARAGTGRRDRQRPTATILRPPPRNRLATALSVGEQQRGWKMGPWPGTTVFGRRRWSFVA